MEATIYEKTYECVKSAEETSELVMPVVELLQTRPEGMTCQEIGNILFGDAYTAVEVGFNNYLESRRHNQNYRHLSRRLGHVLSHLIKNGYVTKEKIHTTDPVTDASGSVVTYEKWVIDDPKTIDRFIEVWDANGNKYSMQNPHWVPGGRGHRQVFTAYKSYNIYKWVREI